MQMDVCTRVSFSVNDITTLHGFCTGTLEPTDGLVGDFSVDELAYGATKFLNIQDDEDAKGVSQIKDECEIINEDNENLFNKCDAISCSNAEILIDNDNVGSVNPHCSNAPSIPNILKPVSAMKGSREKRGKTPPKKLTVKWAPDVYDPVVPAPTLHIIKRPRKHGSKKKSKSKDKNTSKSSSSSSRGSKGKEKKQIRKRSGSCSDLGIKLCEHEEEVIHVSEVRHSAMDFHVGIPDLYCGGSFVNRYGSSLHLSSVTEAT